jgi:hypothetical protein
VRPTVGCAVTAEAGFGGGARRHQHGPEGKIGRSVAWPGNTVDSVSRTLEMSGATLPPPLVITCPDTFARRWGFG